MSTYQLVTDRIIAKLEQGVVPWRQTWASGTGLGECKSLISQKPYRGINAFLTAAQAYRSPYWLTYKQALEVGAQVRSGEKGTPIVYFSKLEKQDADGEKREVAMLRHYTVFNVEQIDGLKLKPEWLFPDSKREFQPIEAAERIKAGMPQAPRLQHVEQRAFYSPHMDYVNMPKPETFTSPEEYYSTLFHELTHSTGHESRLARQSLTKVAAFGSHEYSREELVAEMGAAFLCHVAGIDAPVIDNQAAYLASWLKVLKANPKMLLESAGQAQKAADFILRRSA